MAERAEANTLPREVIGDLEAAGIARGRPVLAVDADEVLVAFAAHLAEWLQLAGYEMRLKRYELEGSIYPIGDPVPLDFQASIRLIDMFFEEETRNQRALEGAVEAVGRIAREAQVVVLTNIPRHARLSRVQNLAGLGIEAPVVANSGGKGRALAWLSDRADAPCVFVDDSPQQIASAAKRAEAVGRIHFRGSPYIRPVLPTAREADAMVEDWSACEATIRRYLGL